MKGFIEVTATSSKMLTSINVSHIVSFRSAGPEKGTEISLASQEVGAYPFYRIGADENYEQVKHLIQDAVTR